MLCQQTALCAWLVLMGLFAAAAYAQADEPGEQGGETAVPPAGAAERRAPPERDVAAVVKGNTAFAHNLYAKLRHSDGNLFFSPGSISTALAMTYGGARGTTAEQMADVLGFSLPSDRLHRAFAALAEQLREAGKSGGNRLSIANALWGQKGEGFLPEFLNLTGEEYGAGFREVDFAAVEAARQLINAWVADRTEGRIKELIPKGVLDKSTALVLTNAIYFKGRWASQFDKADTRDAPFHLAADKSVDAPMMNQAAQFAYAEDGETQVLELPYEGERLSMVVVLPKDTTGLAAIERGLTPEKLAGWVSSLHKMKVMVTLPRFTFTSEFGLADVLKDMGMKDAFVPDEADFSGMNGRRNLFISAVLHKAFVDVNEEGTEAAAATGVVVGLTAFRPPPRFVADHPFLFLIRDRETGSILFMGRVANPSP